MDLAYQICIELHVCPEQLLKRKIRGLQGYTTYDLVSALITTNSMVEAAAKLGYSDNPIKQSVSEVFSDKLSGRAKEFGSGGAVPSWRHTLLAIIDHKYCSGCNSNLPYTRYPKTCTRTNGINSLCKPCSVVHAKQYKYYLKQRTPVWSDLSAIRDIYNKCPEGCHVDHDIPLRGELVSGLHVPSNLKYLTKEDNLAKGNRYLVD